MGHGESTPSALHEHIKELGVQPAAACTSSISLSRDAFTLEPAWGPLPPRELPHSTASPWQLCTHCGCIPRTQATFNAVTKVTQTGFKDLSLSTISSLISFPSQPPPLHTR